MLLYYEYESYCKKKNNKISIEEKNIPSLPSRDHILINVKLAAICRTDIYAAQGKIPTKNPVILGHEFAGILEAKGSNVQGIEKGDRVGVNPIFKFHNQYKMLGIDLDGCFANYVVVPKSHIFKVKPHIDFKNIAFLEPVAASLAVTKAPISIHDKGIILGNNRIAELTKRILMSKGFIKIDIVSPKEIETLQENSIDFAIETELSKKNINDLIDCLKPGGKIIFKSRNYNSIAVPIIKIVQKEIQIHGTFYGDFQESLNLIESQTLNIHELCGETYYFESGIKLLSEEITATEEKKYFLKF